MPPAGAVDWTDDEQSLVCLIAAAPRQDRLAPENHHLLMMFHAGADAESFIIPAAVRSIPWQTFINTAAESPADIYPSLDGPPAPADGHIRLEGRSMVVLIAPDKTRPIETPPN